MSGVVETLAIVFVVSAFAWAGRSFGRRMGRFAATDVVVSLQLFAEWLVHLASRRMPAAHRARYHDEWLAELDALRREHENQVGLSLVLFALRILLRARRTAGSVDEAKRVTTGPAPVDAPAGANPRADDPDDLEPQARHIVDLMNAKLFVEPETEVSRELWRLTKEYVWALSEDERRRLRLRSRLFFDLERDLRDEDSRHA